MLEKIKTLRKITQRFVASLEPVGSYVVKPLQAFTTTSTSRLRREVLVCES